MKDPKMFLLGLLSVGLIGTWVYHLYDKTQYSKRKTAVYIKDSIAVAQGIQDSLQKIYAVTISNLDSRLDSTRTSADSLKLKLNSKLREIYRLKNEINGILKNRGASKADLVVAREKINELQLLVNDLKSQNESMEEEKERLSGLMSKLSGEIDTLQKNMTRLGEENKLLNEKINMASVFVASEINLTPVMVKNGKEQETNQSRKTSKLVISFNVQNNIIDYKNTDVYVVITQPDGNVLTQDDVWETNTLDLKKGGKIPFTRKIRFEYSKGEIKKLLSSIDAVEYMKGTYTLQLYHNGYMIGQVMKSLM
jgi:peptidoglycan hydrolase CwlO-like protein